jgi:hypothetical protein
MSNKNESAFPCQPLDGSGNPCQGMRDGLTKLEYFAARAPAEPQDWFEPVMPLCPERKEVPPVFWNYNWTHGGDSGERWWTHPADKIPLIAKEAYAIHTSARKAYNQWQIESSKQRLIQWPFAWARAVLAAQENQQ